MGMGGAQGGVALGLIPVISAVGRDDDGPGFCQPWGHLDCHPAIPGPHEAIQLLLASEGGQSPDPCFLPITRAPSAPTEDSPN